MTRRAPHPGRRPRRRARLPKRKKPIVEEPKLPPDAPKIELLSTGEDPKKELRYSFKEGQSQEWIMKQLTKVTVEGAPKQPPNMPAMAFSFKITTDKVEPNGVGHLQFSYSKAEFEESDLPKGIQKKMNEAFDEISKVKGSQVVTNRGFVLQFDLDSSEVKNERLKTIVDSMKKSFRQMSNPLPREPVGVGAKWKVVYTVELMGMALEQFANYEVVSLDGSKVGLKVEIKQEAADTKVALPGTASGAEVEVKKLDAKGSGTVTVDLNHLLPTSSLTYDTTIVTREAKRPEVTTNMSVTLNIAPAK